MFKRIMISCVLLLLTQILNIVLPPNLQPQTIIKNAQSLLRNEPRSSNDVVGCNGNVRRVFGSCC
jgi:hypothetical protein